MIGSAGTEAEVKSALLPGVTLRQYALLPEGRDVGLIGERVGDIEWLDGVELASVTRFGVSLTIDPDLVLEPDDQLALLGPDSVMPAAGQPAPLRPARS